MRDNAECISKRPPNPPLSGKTAFAVWGEGRDKPKMVVAHKGSELNRRFPLCNRWVAVFMCPLAVKGLSLRCK